MISNVSTIPELQTLLWETVCIHPIAFYTAVHTDIYVTITLTLDIFSLFIGSSVTTRTICTGLSRTSKQPECDGFVSSHQVHHDWGHNLFLFQFLFVTDACSNCIMVTSLGRGEHLCLITHLVPSSPLPPSLHSLIPFPFENRSFCFLLPSILLIIYILSFSSRNT